MPRPWSSLPLLPPRSSARRRCEYASRCPRFARSSSARKSRNPQSAPFGRRRSGISGHVLFARGLLGCGPRGELGAGADTELRVDAGERVGDGLLAEVQRRGDLRGWCCPWPTSAAISCSRSVSSPPAARRAALPSRVPSARSSRAAASRSRNAPMRPASAASALQRVFGGVASSAAAARAGLEQARVERVQRGVGALGAPPRLPASASGGVRVAASERDLGAGELAHGRGRRAAVRARSASARPALGALQGAGRERGADEPQQQPGRPCAVGDLDVSPATGRSRDRARGIARRRRSPPRCSRRCARACRS